MKKHVLICLAALSFAVSKKATAQIEPQFSNRGMYAHVINDEILSEEHPEKQTELLQYAQANKITYIALYGLTTTDPDLRFSEDPGSDFTFFVPSDMNLDDEPEMNPVKAQQLSNFIIRAKRDFGIEEIGSVGGKIEHHYDLVSGYNSYPINISQLHGVFNLLNRYNGNDLYKGKIDVINLEYEFWNQPNPNTAYVDYIALLNYMKETREDFTKHAMRTEAYVAFLDNDNIPDKQQMEDFAKYVDRLFLSFYNPNSANLFEETHLRRLRACDNDNLTQQIQIWPIFHSGSGQQGNYMTPTFNIDEVERDFLTQLNSKLTYLTPLPDGSPLIPAKPNIHYSGAMWFKYETLKNFTADPHPFSVTLGAPINRGVNSCPIAITATVQGGVGPFEYKFFDENGALIQSGSSNQYVTNLIRSRFSVVVTDANNSKAQDYTYVYSRNRILLICPTRTGRLLGMGCFNDVNFFPNPSATSLVTINLEGVAAAHVQVRITHPIFGNVLKYVQAPIIEGSNAIPVDISGLQKGTYRISVNCADSPDKVYSGLFVKE